MQVKPMNQSLLLTLAGPDKPGLVHDLANHISSCGGNWQQSRLSHLNGHFAGVVDITVAESQRPAFESGLVGLRDSGLQITVYDAAEKAAASPENLHHARIAVVGNDRPGIVASISQALALHAVNVEELQSDVADAPMASGALFQGNFVVSYATTSQLDKAQAEIESLAHDLMIDIKPEDA